MDRRLPTAAPGAQQRNIQTPHPREQPTPSSQFAIATRSLDVANDPAAVYAAVTNSGLREDTVLLESAALLERRADRSLIIVDTAVRITADAQRVRLTALTQLGETLVDRFRRDYPSAHAGQTRRVRGRVTLDLATPPTIATPIDDRARLTRPSPLDVVRAIHRLLPVATPPTPQPFLATLFAYDLIDRFERLPSPRCDPHHFPDAIIRVPETFIEIDHARQRTTITGLHSHATSIHHVGVEQRLADIARRCVHVADIAATPGSNAPIATDLSDSHFAALVDRIREHVRAGDVFQAVPSRTFHKACRDPFASYVALRERNPSPYMFFSSGPEGTVFGASPETCVKVAPDGSAGETLQVEVRPIAGTCPRGFDRSGHIDHELDARQQAALMLDDKETAEHMMLVDLARNDVARVSEPGTRRVTQLLGVEKYSSVMHLVSNVAGRLASNLDALHAYAALANMGTLVGAPKLEAARLLREYEPMKRGPYGGAIGYLRASLPDGALTLDTAITIRSAWIRDGIAYVRAGAGVVHDSIPERECMETRHKAQAVLEAIR